MDYREDASWKQMTKHWKFSGFPEWQYGTQADVFAVRV
jgi:hypothetical protein